MPCIFFFRLCHLLCFVHFPHWQYTYCKVIIGEVSCTCVVEKKLSRLTNKHRHLFCLYTFKISAIFVSWQNFSQWLPLILMVKFTGSWDCNMCNQQFQAALHNICYVTLVARKCCPSYLAFRKRGCHWLRLQMETKTWCWTIWWKLYDGKLLKGLGGGGEGGDFPLATPLLTNLPV